MNTDSFSDSSICSADKNLLQIKTVTYAAEIEAITKIRAKVFQEEQGVSAELEFDGQDEKATHWLAYLNGEPVGTARIREINDSSVKIERLAVLPEARRQGIGKKLMNAVLKTIFDQDKSQAIVHAQCHIARLYKQLGFRAVGEKFTEAGIDHIKMVKDLTIE